MGIYCYAVDTEAKKYFSAPKGHPIKHYGICAPGNPFPNMLCFMNIRGYNFEIWDDTGNDIPPSPEYEDVTEEVYSKYVEEYKDCFN